ncbi:hypothetical protein NUU61_009858 [Penicillium alfredii]|uniref:Tr-type G domain-containing protein n=1 Tax=Penicillium alfredii TaxID=1506179 RepID=A0A9W9EGZ7_9EURO|nr:uncharacterized protein NUU61_009858 [Penicillium alfredii]KAJ5081594.1 hypothetical protein NUU61_009858 [Penicillium alfredii]
MASIFTYDPDPPRVSSPWSTSGSSTPQITTQGSRGLAIRARSSTTLDRADPDVLSDYGITKLEPEPQEGPTEYKLHILLRPRRPYLAMSTGNVVAGSYHSRASLPPTSNSASPGQETPLRPMQAKSSQSRQQRLQGLTTQLLWRLQQSSPFHSSTTSNLVVPVLPEATPKLGVPAKPARLLPGLEESQGALYEIGVADDGTFVGLTQDELDESVTNLQAMAASLGCRVEILRRVIVGQCEWAEDSPLAPSDLTKNRTESLWVAEALVSPDLDFYNLSPVQARQKPDGSAVIESGPRPVSEEDYSHTEQIRVSIAGPSTAGKSSLLGTLTSSSLDNGRGKSRLSLLKHRHEISSGITSSVAQELLGYTEDVPSTVVNYASGNVAGWDDIHAASLGGRLAFVSDLPGSVRYLKSTLRGLVSWAPHYVLLCIPANCGDETPENEPTGTEHAEIDLCLSYLDLCLKLEVPVLIVITKLDIASRGGLRENLARVLSALKAAGRKPAMLPASPASDKTVDLQQIKPADTKDAQKTILAADGNWSHTVPIVLASAVDGTGIGKLHAFLRYLPIPKRPPQRILRLPKTEPSAPCISANVFAVDEVFAIPPPKSIQYPRLRPPKTNVVWYCAVSISIGDEMVIGPILVDTSSDSGNEPPPPGPLSRGGPGPTTEFSASFAQSLLFAKDPTSAQARWQRVRVVSVRDLRLPVRRLIEDQVGTIGIELISSADDGRLPRLGRIRKGMVLSDLHKLPFLSHLGTQPAPLQSSVPSSTLPLPFHTGFCATFPASAFSAPRSPPLLLGGNAIAYIANLRTTVRVVCMALAGAGDDRPSDPSSPSEPEFFSFDGDGQGSPSWEKPSSSSSNGATTGSTSVHVGGGSSIGHDHGHGNGTASHDVTRRSSTADISKVVAGTASSTPAALGTAPSAHQPLSEDVKISFTFVTSVEWIELGSQVLVMPGVSMASSSGVAVASAAESGSAAGTVPMSGLEGFVGTVCDVVSGKIPGIEV